MDTLERRIATWPHFTILYMYSAVLYELEANRAHLFEPWPFKCCNVHATKHQLCTKKQFHSIWADFSQNWIKLLNWCFNSLYNITNNHRQRHKMTAYRIRWQHRLIELKKKSVNIDFLGLESNAKIAWLCPSI